MADKELNIKLGAKDAGMSAALSKVMGSVDALNKKVGDVSKVFAIGAFADRMFDGMAKGLEKIRDLQHEVGQGAITLGQAYEQAAESVIESLPVLGPAYKFGKSLGKTIVGEDSDEVKNFKMLEANAEIAKRATDSKAFSELLALQSKLAMESARAGMSPEEQERAKVRDATEQRLKNLRDAEAKLNPSTEAQARIAGIAAGKATNSILAMQDQEMEKIEQKAAEEARKNADRLAQLQTDIIIEQHEMAGEKFEADKARIMAELNRRLAGESDPQMQAALKEMADLQLAKVNREIDKAIEESINGVPFAEAAEKEQTNNGPRQRAAMLESQFLTGATGNSPAVKESQKQTKAINQMSEDIRMLRETFGEHVIVAAVKRGIRGR